MKALLLFAALALQSPQAAQDLAAQADACVYGPDPETVIEACTAVIQSGRWSESELAWAYANRGNGLSDLDEMGRAIADYDRAIEIDPDRVVETIMVGPSGPATKPRQSRPGSHHIALEIPATLKRAGMGVRLVVWGRRTMRVRT